MSDRNFVYSTLSTDVFYVPYHEKLDQNDMPIAEKDAGVLIKGGANVATKHLVTPKGVVTTVSDEQLEMLEKNDLFQLHKKNGFIIVDTSKVDPEVRAADMEQRDDSAPATPNDYDGQDGVSQPSASNRKPSIFDKIKG